MSHTSAVARGGDAKEGGGVDLDTKSTWCCVAEEERAVQRQVIKRRA